MLAPELSSRQATTWNRQCLPQRRGLTESILNHRHVERSFGRQTSLLVETAHIVGQLEIFDGENSHAVLLGTVAHETRL